MGTRGKRPRRGWARWTVFGVLAAVGAVCALGAVEVATSDARLAERGRTTSATVEQVLHADREDSSALVRFTAADGSTRHPEVTGFAPDIKVGGSVRLIVDPADPDEVRALRADGTWAPDWPVPAIFPVILWSFAALTLVSGRGRFRHGPSPYSSLSPQRGRYKITLHGSPGAERGSADGG